MTTHHVAFFISPHGFGHAARACAVMAALANRQPCHFHIFTSVPQWFFAESLTTPFSYHLCQTDVGLVQHSPTEEDIPSTLRQLAALLPYRTALLSAFAAQLHTLGCALVCCDISPLGVAVAEQAALPSVLIENFTWGYIYAGYSHPELTRYGNMLDEWRSRAKLCIQAAPVTERNPTCPLVAPISRAPRQTRAAVRAKLGLPDRPAVLLTMGGHSAGYAQRDRLQAQTVATVVLPGSSVAQPTWQGSCLLLPTHGAAYHPDLLHACDLVVGKLGYSTIAESWQAGLPFVYIPRPQFRESAVIANWLQHELACAAISEDEWQQGDWIARLPLLLQLPRQPATAERANGAKAAADLIADFGLLGTQL